MKIKILTKLTALFLIFTCLQNTMVASGGTISQKDNIYTATDNECLAPRSYYSSVLIKDYGTGNSHYQHGLVASDIDIKNKNIIPNEKTSLFSSITQGIGNSLNTLKKFLSRSFIIVAFGLMLVNMPVNAQEANLSPPMQYNQSIKTMIIDKAGMKPYIQSLLIEDAVSHSDYQIRSEALNILTSYHCYPQIYEVINNPSTPEDTKKEAILSVYSSSRNNVFFFGEIIDLLAENNLDGSNNSTLSMTLNILEDAIITNPLAFQNLAYAAEQKKMQLRQALLLIMENDNFSDISKERANQIFFSSFATYEELAKLIVGFDQNLDQNSKISPLQIIPESNMIITHNMAHLKNLAEIELKKRISLTLTAEYAHKKNQDNSFLESFMGNKQIYSRMFLPSLQNNNYEKWWINALMPELYSHTQEQYNKYIDNVSQFPHVTGKEIDISVYKNDAIFDAFLSPVDIIRNEALNKLTVHNTSTALLNTAISSTYSDLRQTAAAHIANNPEMMLRLYIASQHDDTKVFAQNNIYRLASQNPEDFITAAKASEAFRNNLIDVIKDTDSEENRELITYIFLKAQPSAFELIGINKHIEQNLNIDDALKQYLQNSIEAEIQIRLAKEIIQYKIDAYNTRYASIPFVNKDTKIIQYENILEALNNTSSIDINILETNAPEVMTELNQWLKDLKETYSSPSNNTSTNNKSFKEIVKRTYSNIATYYDLAKQKGLSKYLLFLPALVIGTMIFLRRKKKNDNQDEPDQEPLYESRPDTEKDAEKIYRKKTATISRDIVDNIKSYSDLSENNIDNINETLLLFQPIKYSCFTAKQENKLLSMCIDIINNNDGNAIKIKKTEEIIKILIKKIVTRSNSSSEENLRKSDNQHHLAEVKKDKNESVFYRLKQLFSKNNRLNNDMLDKISQYEDKNKTFTTYIKKTRKELLGTTILLTVTKFLMIILPFILNLFSVVPASLILIWIIAISFIGFTEMLNQLFIEGVTQLYDKKLASIVEKLVRNNKINSEDKPKVYRITTAEIGRWKILQTVAGVIGIFLGLLIVKPIILPALIPVTIIAFFWIFYSTLKPKGIDDAQTSYLNEAEKYNREIENHDFVSKSFPMDKKWEDVNKKRLKYHKSSIVFSSVLFLFINIIIPTIGIIFGVPVFGFLIATYMNFFFKTNHIMRQISEGSFHTTKLKTMLSHIENKAKTSASYEWKQTEAEEKNLPDYEIGNLKLKNISIKVPGTQNVYILRKQNITFNKGEITFISAPSGAGKTIFGETIAFKKSPNSGDILIDTGKKSSSPNWIEASPKSFKLKNIKERIQYHSFTNIENKNSINTILEDLQINNGKREKFLKNIKQIMPEFAVQDLEKEFTNFSAGQRRKIKLIMIILSRETPTHIVLDEPFAGMDANSIKQTLFFLKQWQKKTNSGIIITDHAKIDASNFTQSISISNGEIIPYENIKIQQDIMEILHNKYHDSIFQHDLIRTIDKTKIKELPLREIQQQLKKENPPTPKIPTIKYETKEDNENADNNPKQGIEEKKTLSDMQQEIFNSIEKYCEIFPHQPITLVNIKNNILHTNIPPSTKEDMNFILNIKCAALILAQNTFNSQADTIKVSKDIITDTSEFLITVNMLKQYSVKQQRQYMNILRTSGNFNDRNIYIAMENTLVNKNKENLNELRTNDLLKFFISNKSSIDSAFRNKANNTNIKIIKEEVEKYLHEHMQKAFLAMDIESKIPVKTNIADYIHTMHFILKNDHLHNFSSQILRQKWSKTFHNLKILKKYNLRFSTDNIKLVQQSTNEKDTDIKLLNKILKSESSRLAKIKKGSIYTFSGADIRAHKRWQLLQNIRLNDPIKFDSIAGGAISDYKLYQHVIKSMDQAFGGLWQNQFTNEPNEHKPEPNTSDNLDRTSAAKNPTTEAKKEKPSIGKQELTQEKINPETDAPKKQETVIATKTNHKIKFKTIKSLILGIALFIFGLTGINYFLSNDLSRDFNVDQKKHQEWENVFSDQEHITNTNTEAEGIITSFATIKEDVISTIAPEQNGNIDYIRNEGSVDKGDILFRYANPTLIMQLSQAEENYTLLNKNYQRSLSIEQAHKGSIAQNDLLKQEAARDQAQITLQETQLAVNNLTVRAQASGTFVYSLKNEKTLRNFIKGQYIQEDQVIGYIVNQNTQRINLNISTTDVPDNIYPGNITSININGNDVPVKILKVTGTPSPYNSTFNIECLISDTKYLQQEGNLQISIRKTQNRETEIRESTFASSDYMKAAGFITYRKQQLITAPYEGYINGMSNEMYEGETMEDNQNSISILNHEINAEIQRLFSKRKIAYKILEVNQYLQSQDAVSLTELEVIRNSYELIDAEYQSALGKENGLRIPLPSNWMIEEIFARNGEWVEKDKPILRLIDKSSAEIQATIGQDAAKEMTIGDTVMVRIPSKENIITEGKITYIQTDNTGRATVMISIPGNINLILNANTPVEIFIPRTPIIEEDIQIRNTNRITEPIINKNIVETSDSTDITKPNNNISQMHKFKLDKMPVALIGIFALLSILTIGTLKKKSNDNNIETITSEIGKLIIKGHPLRDADGNKTTLTDLYDIYKNDGYKKLEGFLFIKLNNKKISQNLAKYLSSNKVFNYTQTKFKQYKNDSNVKNLQGWPLPLSETIGNTNAKKQDSPQTLLNWSKEWIKWFPNKFNQLGKNTNIHKELTLEMTAIAKAEKDLDENMKYIINNHNEHDLKTMLPEYLNIREKIAEFRWKITFLGKRKNIKWTNKYATDINKLFTEIKKQGVSIIQAPISMIEEIEQKAQKENIILQVVAAEKTNKHIFIENLDQASSEIIKQIKRQAVQKFIQPQYIKKENSNTKKPLMQSINNFRLLTYMAKHPTCFLTEEYSLRWSINLNIYKHFASKKSLENKNDIFIQAA